MLVSNKMSPLWIYLLMVAGSSHGARILGIFPTPSISHQLPFQAVMKALALKGHQVTVLSPNPLKTPHVNYTDVDLSFTYEYMFKHIDMNKMANLSPWNIFELFNFMGSGVCHAQLSSDVMQDFIRSNPRFDLVFIESLLYQCMYGLVHHVGSPPMIGILSMGAIYNTFEATGNPYNPSYMPDSLWPYTDHMSFWQRANNMNWYFSEWYEEVPLRYVPTESHYTIVYMHNSLGNLMLYMLHTKYRGDSIQEDQEELMRQYFGPDPPSVWETEKNYSLVMVSHHWSVSYPKPLLPNIIELGPLHIQKTKPLPKDLAEFLDDASEGFVYFSLGSNVRSDKLPEHKRQQLLEAFAQLPQRVLWKWESDTLPGQPSNVKLGKWLPQQDILAHPNIRLFVTQGGLQSFQEATHFGVPLVVIPFIADQKYNARKIVSSGVGLEVTMETATTETFLAAFKDVINNNSYRDTMKKVSAITKDQPETPIERAVWWTEYVLRHNGAKHLRSAALDLTWWQYLLLDVIAFLLISFIVTLIVVYYIVKKMLSFILFRITSKPKLD